MNDETPEPLTIGLCREVGYGSAVAGETLARAVLDMVRERGTDLTEEQWQALFDGYNQGRDEFDAWKQEQAQRTEEPPVGWEPLPF